MSFGLRSRIAQPGPKWLGRAPRASRARSRHTSRGDALTLARSRRARPHASGATAQRVCSRSRETRARSYAALAHGLNARTTRSSPVQGLRASRASRHASASRVRCCCCRSRKRECLPSPGTVGVTQGATANALTPDGDTAPSLERPHHFLNAPNMVSNLPTSINCEEEPIQHRKTTASERARGRRACEMHVARRGR